MKWNVFIRQQARTDVQRAADWYNKGRLGLGDEFLAAAAYTFARIEGTPEIFPIYYRQFRQALTPLFPYKVFFVIRGDSVIIFRVLHAARDHTKHLR